MEVKSRSSPQEADSSNSNHWLHQKQKMVTTRGQNATTEANPSVTKLTKEQNDSKIKQCQQYAAKEPLDQYQLNLYVLDLNYNSTIT